MASLYQISEKYLEIFNRISVNEEDGSIDQADIALYKELDHLEDDFENKAINVSYFIKNLQAEHDQVKKARQQMQAREQRLQKLINWKITYLKRELQKLGINEISSSPHFVIKLRQNPAKLNIINSSLIPDEYKVITISIDNAKLKADLKNKVILGAILEHDVSVQIK